MTQITLTIELEKESNIPTLRKLIKNMKGVVKVTIARNSKAKKGKRVEGQRDTFLENLHKLAGSMDSSQINFEDEKNLYILRGTRILENYFRSSPAYTAF